MTVLDMVGRKKRQAAQKWRNFMFILLNLPVILPAAQSGKEKTHHTHTYTLTHTHFRKYQNFLHQTGGKSCAREGELLLMKYHLVSVWKDGF